MSKPISGPNTPPNVYLRGAGERGDVDGIRWLIQKPCTIKSGGKWYCEIHQKRFNGDAESWAHTSDRDSRHSMIWICKVHGPEQPGD